MKTKLLLLFLLSPFLTLAQNQNVSIIKIEAKPENPKKGYGFDIYKSEKDIKIFYKRIDSNAKIVYSKKDLITLTNLVGKLGRATRQDTLSVDSSIYIQKKLDSIAAAYVVYEKDSTTIYKSSHPIYWKFLETIFNTPDQVLAKKQQEREIKDGVYCFFTIIENRDHPDRYIFIEDLDPKIYPLLVKLVNDTEAIMVAHQAVMKRKSQ